jgi:uncharacterized phage protein (TIGR02220 family)
MAKDPAFLFYPGDYLRDTQNLSENAQVAYDRIMCEHMRNICISQQQLKFFTKRLEADEVEMLRLVLVEVEGGFQIEWVADSINKRKAYSDSRRKNREGKTKKDMNNISKTYDNHMENENENEDVIDNDTETGNENYNLLRKFGLFVDLFNRIKRSKFKGDKKARGQFKQRIKEGFSMDDFEQAIRNCMSDPYHKENPNYLTPEFITRSDKLEKYLNYQAPNPGKGNAVTVKESSFD